MQYTEDKRHVIDSHHRDPPSDIMKMVKEYDHSLELIWNNDDTCWELYRLKYRGGIPSEDTLCWQVTPEWPISIDYLRKIDIIKEGHEPLTDVARKKLRQQWLKDAKERQQKYKQYKQNELKYWQNYAHDIYKTMKPGRSTLCVDGAKLAQPVGVWVNHKTGERREVWE